MRIMRHRSNLIGGRLGVSPRPEGGTVVTVERWPSGKNAEAGGGGRLSS